MPCDRTRSVVSSQCESLLRTHFRMSLILPASSVVGRLAPSPTGGLHLGHARTFLIAWLTARQSEGRVILRIEDLDSSRVRIDALATALDDLVWLGLDWDEGPGVGGPSAPYLQSQRSPLYDG